MPAEAEALSNTLTNMESKATISEVEELPITGADLTKTKTMGTVKLTEGEIVYVPTPTADPQGMESLQCRSKRKTEPSQIL
jgi:hypothetical protein